MLILTLLVEGLGARRRCEVDLYLAESNIQSSGRAPPAPPQMGRNGSAERERSSLTRLITMEVPCFSLPALPSRTWRPLNPPAALEGDLEKVERWAAADHAGPLEGLGSISDAWLRVRGWWRVGQFWGAVTPGSFNRSCWTFIILFGFQSSVTVLGWC